MKTIAKSTTCLTAAVFACICFCFLLSGCAVGAENGADLQRSISSSSLTAVEEAAAQVAASTEEDQNPNAVIVQGSTQDRSNSNVGSSMKQPVGSPEKTTPSNTSTSSPAVKSQEDNTHEHSWVSKERVVAPAQSITKKCAKGNSHHTMWVVKSAKDGNKEHLYYRESDARAFANQLKAEGYSPICNSWYRPHYLTGTKSAVIETYEACSCGAERNHTRSGGVETWSDDGSPCQAWWGK